MTTEKKYFWFKMEDDFFQKKEIKKLRSIAGGDTYVVIYLKIILLSLKTGGKLYFEGIDDDFISEIALTIDENKDNVGITMEYLLRHSVVIEAQEAELHLTSIPNLIGSETATAIRVRKHREKAKVKLLQCNDDVTGQKQNDNGELELQSELDIELDKYIDHPGQAPTDTPQKDETEKLRKQAAFNHFWELYDKKQKREKSLSIFMKIDESLYPEIMDHVKRYVASTPDKRYRSGPAVYLGNKGWNDEIIQPGPGPGPRKDNRMWQERNPFFDSLPPGTDLESLGFEVINKKKQIGGK